MQPVALFHKQFLGRAYPRIPQHRYIYAPHDNASEMYYTIPPHYLKIIPRASLNMDSCKNMPVSHYLTLIIHSGTPSPPPPPPPDNDRICDHNAMLAFPQKKISHYTTEYNTILIIFIVNVCLVIKCSPNQSIIPLHG